MPVSLDIELIPLNRRSGQDIASLPGLQIAQPPRRAARSRAADLLVLYLSSEGSNDLPVEEVSQILTEMARNYYETAGSVTTALRTAIEAANRTLLKRNQDAASRGQQAAGVLTLASFRGDQVYLAQSGPAYAQWISQNQSQELSDPSVSGRGLGIAQTPSIRLHHASLQPGDALVIAPRSSPNWAIGSLDGLYGQEPGIQVGLLLRGAADFVGILVRVKAGSGKLYLSEVRPAALAVEAIPSPLPQAGRTTSPLPPITPGETEDDIDLVEQQALADQYQPLPELEMLPAMDQAISTGAVSISSETPVASVSLIQEPPRPPAKPPKTSTARSDAGVIARKAGRGVATIFNRILPEQTIAAIPTSIMAAMAILVPIMVVATATAVYFRRGLAAQSEQVYAQAVQAAQSAQTQTAPLQRREALLSSLAFLDIADSYRLLPESQDLRTNLAGMLDEIDLVRRLAYQPAIIGGLPADAQITRMALSGLDLYLLDKSKGTVLRAFYSNQGYQLDPSFQCGPADVPSAGPMVDLSPWPSGLDPAAAVVAMDAKGVMLFCQPGQPPGVIDLPDPPNLALGNITGFALDLRDLYVLDPVANGVWVYWNGDFEGEPAYYFGDQVPQIQDVMDLAANNEELYLLHSDGRVALCITGSLGVVTPTRCEDPVRYMDTRPGRESTQLTPESPYTQILYSPPPDPSLFLLDSANRAIDRYSLRNLAFQHRYLPAQPLPSGAASAYYVDPVERLVFLALTNRVYYANLP